MKDKIYERIDLLRNREAELDDEALKLFNAFCDSVYKDNDSFLEEFAGVGLENITAKEKSIPYLALVQPDSTATAEGQEPGTWRNSATGENLGNVVSVVVLDFKPIWSERSNQPPFGTVARYEPESIPVNKTVPKDGGYPVMTNPETGLEIQELYLYAVLLPEHPEYGVMLMSLPVGCMKTCRSWNTQLTNQLLGNGAKAPAFAFTWDLAAGLVENPKKKGSKIAKFMKVQRGVRITKELLDESVRPQLPNIKSTVLSLTAEPAED